jgi:hypothetical protein
VGLHLVLAVQTDLAGPPAHLEQSLADAIASLRPTGMTTASLGRQGRGSLGQSGAGAFPRNETEAFVVGAWCDVLVALPSPPHSAKASWAFVALGDGMCGS